MQANVILIFFEKADKTSTIPMADKAEPRREFVDQNTKYVQNLDV